jgi:anhydro-N-acetylmuramic acid kinase
LKILGIMSGTSVDGVDYTLCKLQNKKHILNYQDKAFVPFPKKLKEEILKAASNELDFWSVAQLHYDLGEFYSESLKKIKKNKKWSFDLIGLHGQTVFHSPKKSTMQIGEASFLKKDFNVPVVSQFRNIDIALKGQGAPFAPFFHKELMKNEKRTWAFQNLGGIGNVTSLQNQKLIAFDTGPANMLMDEYMQMLFKKPFDLGGKIAQKGLPNEGIVQFLLKDISYFSLKPPKSCGRENFSAKALKTKLEKLNNLSPEDQISTLTEFTARTLKDQYTRFLKQMPEIIVVAGGGAKNSHLMKRIQFHLPKSKVVTSDDYCGWPVDAIEGGAFAWMALERINESKIKDLSSVTGAETSSMLGSIY